MLSFKSNGVIQLKSVRLQHFLGYFFASDRYITIFTKNNFVFPPSALLVQGEGLVRQLVSSAYGRALSWSFFLDATDGVSELARPGATKGYGLKTICQMGDHILLGIHRG